MDIECSSCGALHWIDERTSKSSKIKPKFSRCFREGKLKLPLLLEPPQELMDLLEGDDPESKFYRDHMREFNAANAYTSLGCNLDKRVVKGKGPKGFAIHGELQHNLRTLLPDEGKKPIYHQLFFYDPNQALAFRAERNPQLNKNVLEKIQKIVYKYNVFCHKYYQAQDLLSDANPGDGSLKPDFRDIILHRKGKKGLKRISECHPAYLPLHYVLLFPYSEMSWQPYMKQRDPETGKHTTTRLTLKQFHSFRLFKRSTEYSTILRGKKLFQQYLVDAWAATEQNTLFYLKINQDKLRADSYKHIKDSAESGLSPEDLGKPYVLPSTFIGGPRHMYEIYQDSLAITRFNHHPDIFLTMTANPHWPEIEDALESHQYASDRADIVSRVFELKRAELMKEIKKGKVFGNIVAHVYTIEFQKRGLPHMHLLIFLDSPRVQVWTKADIQYIAAATMGRRYLSELDSKQTTQM